MHLSGNKMKGNCKYTEELLVHTPNQQQQHQTIVEEQRQTLHSPTTPVCDGIADRSKFHEHLMNHCISKSDDLDFTKSVFPQLSTFGSLDERNHDSPVPVIDHELEETDESSLHVPRMNSQGKVKTFRCKQCDFVAITKLEFWDHSRSHIKAEKLLTCPKCPFVTEYKHHLEYHLRNHVGSKPFKCDKCSYSCVNKSMLNSHLKSHSNVYQYSCANCSYATKYCHSLKLHLRKYSHKPAMVLNMDGSPNPLPIIDVYGTRRGPKQKSSIKVENELVQHTITNNNLQTNLESSLTFQMSNSQVSPASHFTATAVNGINGTNEINQNQSFAYNHLFSAFTPSNHSLVNENSIVYENTIDQIKFETLTEFTKVTNVKSESAMPNHTMKEATIPNDTMPENTIPSDLNYFEVNNVKPDDSNNVNIISKSPTAVILKPQSDIKEDELESRNIPLDLSKSEMSSNAHHTLNIKSPRPTGTSRRKGKAIKLARRVIEEDTDEDTAKDEMEEPSLPSSPGVQQQEIRDTKDMKEQDFIASAVGNEFTCQYCEIAFGNIIMYTVHMGYHGYNNPYTCNMCGHECTDKVSFFLHMARSKHP